jgi:hypothetical protein
VSQLAVAADWGVQGGQQQRLNDTSPDVIWASGEVREAIAARPGLDVAAERRKLEAWLRDEAGPSVKLTPRLVLSWLEHAQPINRRESESRRPTFRNSSGPAATAYAFNGPWTADRPPPISRIDQERIAAGQPS